MSTPRNPTPITTDAAKRGQHVSPTGTHDRWGRVIVPHTPTCPICGLTQCAPGAIHR